MEKKPTLRPSSARPIRRPVNNRPLYRFRMTMGDDIFTDIPEPFLPYDKNQQWELLGGDSFGIVPFVRRSSDFSVLTTAVGATSHYEIFYEVEDPSVLKVDLYGYVKNDEEDSEMVQIKCLRNGKSKLRLRIRNMTKGREGFTYTKTFEIIVDNPAWSDVRCVNVTL